MAVLRDPQQLPEDLPVPLDDGAARHLTGAKLPPLTLAATDGSQVDLSRLRGRTAVYVYPRTGKPNQPLPTGWDGIPAVRDGHIYEVKSTYILQPGPAALSEGVTQLHDVIQRAAATMER